MTALNGELFGQGPKHEAYWSVATEVLQSADHEAIPFIARQMAMNHLQHMLSLQGSSDFEGWMRDLAESFADGYLFAEAEDWNVDPDTAVGLIDGCMFEVNRSRLAVGSDAITRADYSTWASLILLGLNSDLDEWEPLNEYVRSDGPLERLEWLFPTYLILGEIAEPRIERIDEWRAANLLAWRDGVFLALLYRLGLLSTNEGVKDFHDGDRPLSGTLLELDPGQYHLTAARVIQSTAQAVSDVAKELYWYLIGPLVEPKLVRDFAQWLQDTFECGYVLCVSETWEGLDETRLRELIDQGLNQLIAKKDSRDPRPLLSDPEYRIRNIAYGITAPLPYFADLTAYLEDQGAFKRISALGEMTLSGFFVGGAIKRRHVSKLKSPLALSFILGVSVGLLEQLGEISPTMPERLP